MWLTKQRAQPGPVFGHADKFEGLGLFVDTYKNNRPGTVFPYIMAMNGDGNTPYDKDNDGKANEVAGKAKANAGYETGSKKTEAKGVGKALKGKAQQAAGKTRRKSS